MRSLLLISCFWMGLQGPTALATEASEESYPQWLESQSLLKQAQQFDPEIPELRGAPASMFEQGSVWFMPYPASVITNKEESVLETLGSSALWNALRKLSTQAIYLNSVKQSGSLLGYMYQASEDAYKDRVGFVLDDTLGSQEEYQALINTANTVEAIVLEDLILGNTGRGADFLLAQRAYADYPELFLMLELLPKDWDLLPKVQDEEGAIALPKVSLEALFQKEVFADFGALDLETQSTWAATAPVSGFDGRERRWVYFYHDTLNQPVLNWQTPASGLYDIIKADAVRTLHDVGVKGVHLDLQGFLDFEAAADAPYAASAEVSRIAASLVRSLGGCSFQKLDIPLDQVSFFADQGADLFYDIWSWPTYHYALLTGDAALLRTMLRLIHDYGVQPKQLIHSLQIADPIPNALVHCIAHAEDLFTFRGEQVSGAQLQAWFSEAMGRLSIDTEDGQTRLYLTCTGLCAEAFGIKDPYNIDIEGLKTIQKGHLLMAFFNAMQPGVFLFSGWDLVGALPLTEAQLASRFEQEERHWISRGAYDLLDFNPEATVSASGIPKAQALYGNILNQLKKPDSFVSRLKAIIDIRQQLGIADAKRLAIPQVDNPGVIILIHELPADKGLQVTAVNFGRDAVEEFIELEGLAGFTAVELLRREDAPVVSQDDILNIRLDALEGKTFILEDPNAPRPLASASSDM